MRLLPALASCAVLFAGDSASLRQLEESNRIFELRAELELRGESRGEALLYRAIAMSRFGSEQAAIDQLGKFLAAKPAPDLERKARYELSWALTRLGRYGEAGTEVGAALRLSGEERTSRTDHENVQRLLAALKDVGRQTVEFGPAAKVQARRNPLGLWDVPVEVNSQRGEWIFDTGANYSTVSESEARRLGLTIREVRGSVADFVGNEHPTRLAVAGELRFGAARFRNVVFLVLADQLLFVSPLRYQMRGILGLPVMRAMESVDFSAEGAITFGRGTPEARVPPNLFFDRLNAVVQVGHSGRDVQMMLDTGAAGTVLYPSILDSFAAWERDQLKGSNGAAGGSQERLADLVPFIQLEAGGRTVYPERVALFRKAPADTKGRDGVLGIDALKGGFQMDFRSMRLTLK
jgi:predicted aspartyl protease